MEDKIIVACICKNEFNYLREFVSYHLNIGFDKVVIGDNNDLEGESYEELLADFVSEGKVKIINIRGKKAYQNIFYNEIIDAADYEWCAFIDTDEFITIATNRFASVREFLESNQNVRAYKLNWRIYGDNDCVDRDPNGVVERFPIAENDDFCLFHAFPESHVVKSILHKSVREHFLTNPHAVRMYDDYRTPSGKETDSSSFNHNPEFDNIFIRHYYTKSIGEWIGSKLARGFADRNVDKSSTYKIENFFLVNDFTQEKWDYICSHLSLGKWQKLKLYISIRFGFMRKLRKLVVIKSA